ncbi:MAG: glycosyltransferase family 4 protein, partial [Cyclobacteriaceae bacterium]
MNSIIEKEKKIEVLHLNSEKSWRGGEQQLAYLLDELQLKNVRNYIICREGSALERYCIDHHVQYTSLPFRSGISLRSAQAIKNTCRKLKIDLVHIHSGKPHTLAVLSTLLGNHVPMVLSRRIAFPISNSFFSRWKFNSYVIK